MFKKISFLNFFLFVLLTNSAVSDSSSAPILTPRIERLERQLGDVEREVYARKSHLHGASSKEGEISGKGANAILSSLGQLTLKIGQLKEQNQALLNQLEVANHKIGLLEKNLEGMSQKIMAFDRNPVAQGNDKVVAQGDIKRGEESHRVSPAASGKLPQVSSAKEDQSEEKESEHEPTELEVFIESFKKLPPSEAYQEARSFIGKGEYEKAEFALELFVDLYPKHELTSAALYWLGETHYVRADYKKASKAFFKAEQLEPKGTKSPDSLIKLALSLKRLEKKKEACIILQKLKVDHKGMPQNIRTLMEREVQELRCE